MKHQACHSEQSEESPSRSKAAKKVIIIRGARPLEEIHPVMKIEDLGTE